MRCPFWMSSEDLTRCFTSLSFVTYVWFRFDWKTELFPYSPVYARKYPIDSAFHPFLHYYNNLFIFNLSNVFNQFSNKIFRNFIPVYAFYNIFIPKMWKKLKQNIAELLEFWCMPYGTDLIWEFAFEVLPIVQILCVMRFDFAGAFIKDVGHFILAEAVVKYA